MRRARSADNSNAVSLFPFLAVLVCTMGALIVLLVVMARQAQVRAARSTQHATATVAHQRVQLAHLTSRLEDLSKSRSDVAQQIADDRRVLSHLEDHIERLRDQLAETKLAAQQLVDDGTSSVAQRQRDAAEVARLQRLVAEARQQLEESRREVERRRKSYAIIPYRGPRGTERRPIYIECRSDAVIVQPEGVVLRPDDFAAPLGPGNPLAAAVRAAREYLTERGTDESAAAGDPYPLLLVRPDGIAAYYKAREALSSWDADFGYELIDADWNLALPVADPILAERESRAVAVARQRRAQLVLAAPSRYGGGRSARVATARSGDGFQRFTSVDAEGGGLGDPGLRGSSGRRQHGGPRKDARRPGNNPYAAVLDRSARGSAPASSSPYAAIGTRGPAAALGAAAAPHGRTTDPQQSGGPARTADARPATGTSTPSAHGHAATPSSAAASKDLPGDPTGTSAVPHPAGMPAGGSQSSASAAGGSVGTAPSGGSPGGTQATGQLGAVESLAARRGDNWALPRTARNTVPISRAVRVDVQQDRLVLKPDHGNPAARPIRRIEIPMLGRTEAVVDPLVSNLWDQVATWGIAGRGMYWRPVVDLHVVPDAEWRADQLRKLLDGSGLDLVDKGAVVR